jgi:hypothetical protein
MDKLNLQNKMFVILKVLLGFPDPVIMNSSLFAETEKIQPPNDMHHYW